MPNVNPASIEMTNDDKPELVASDIEDDVLTDFIHLLSE